MKLTNLHLILLLLFLKMYWLFCVMLHTIIHLKFRPCYDKNNDKEIKKRIRMSERLSKWKIAKNEKKKKLWGVQLT
jgi:hypothetical protein